MPLDLRHSVRVMRPRTPNERKYIAKKRENEGGGLKIQRKRHDVTYL